MEIRLKSLLYPALLIAMAIIIGLGVSGIQTSRAQPDKPPLPSVEPRLFPTDAPDVQPTVHPVSVTVGDNSPTWDWAWQPICKPMLETYLGKRYPMRSVQVDLVDDTSLSLGVAVPDMGVAQAIAQSDCEGANGELFCTVTVGVGDPGDPLDVAVTSAMVYAIDEYHRAKTRQEWEGQTAWDWAIFAPLIREVDGVWESDCLEMTR